MGESRLAQSQQKLEMICEVFRGLAGQGMTWVSIPQLIAEAHRRQLNLSRELIGDYVRRYSVNDPSNRNLSPKHYLGTPRFVAADHQPKRGREYRLLSEAERQSFLRDPREDWHERPYAEFEASYAPQVERTVHKPVHRQTRAGAHKKPEARDQRVRVHELARELRIDHRKVIEAAKRHGADVSLPKSGLDDSVATRVRKELAVTKQQGALRAAKSQPPRQVTHGIKEPPSKEARHQPPKKTPSVAAHGRAARQTAIHEASREVLTPKGASAAGVKTKPKSAASHGSRPAKAGQLTVIVDVSNVAREERDPKGRAKLANFLHLVDQLEKHQIKIIAIADATLWGHIDREEEFKECCRTGIIKQAPTRTEADVWILEKASAAGAYIISRDTFRDRIEKYPGCRERIVSFMVFDSEVMLDPEHQLTTMIRQAESKKAGRKRK